MWKEAQEQEVDILDTERKLQLGRGRGGACGNFPRSGLLRAFYLWITFTVIHNAPVKNQKRERMALKQAELTGMFPDRTLRMTANTPF